MAEITEAPPTPPGSPTDAPATATAQADSSEAREDSVPETMRKTKPGLKRLILTLTVFLSFLSGMPFLLKSIEIYRAPLPFREIDSLSATIESKPLLFPCHFRAVFVNFNDIASTADQLELLIRNHIGEVSSKSTACGACSNNFTMSVTLDWSSGCIVDKNGGNHESWKCGALNDIEFDGNSDDYDQFFDEYLNSILDNGKSSSAYTVVLINKEHEKEMKVVVGKHRHAWIIGRILREEAVKRMAEIFVKVFVNGGKDEGSIHGEFMPVGADGKIVLSFNLLNADPQEWLYDWDFQKVDDILLAPIIEALRPVADISVESQVLYHTPKSSFSYWDDKQKSYIFSIKDLPFFVNSNEWHLDTSTAAGGRSKILQFVVYVPSATECPLLLQLPNGEFSSTNGFISPMWGGVAVWNPPACTQSLSSMPRLRDKISPEDLEKIFEVFVGQLRQLFGLKSDKYYVGSSGTSILLTSERGFTEWELDVLSRQHTCFNLLQCGTTLGSLSRLVQSLPRMIIMDEIGKQVKFSLEAATLALSNSSYGRYNDSAVSSRHARSLAENAFYHPSMMSVSYYSFEHCFAVYSPFFLPVSLHVVLAVLRELKRYKQENKKYLFWKANNRI